MADKILNTRIKLKYDSYENWSTKNPVLLAGEIAIATVPTSESNVAGVLVKDNLPNVVIKVGDGTNHFNDLKFVSGLAADVYEWAKAATKPTYQASEIDGLADYIGTTIQDTDTQYTVVNSGDAAAPYKFKLMSRAKGSTAYSTQVAEIDFSAIDTRLKALEEAVGNGGTVSEMIDEKIQALDAAAVTAGTGEVISMVSETDGIISVEKKTLAEADIPALSIAKTTGLQAALDAKQDNLTFEGTYNASTNKAATVSTVTDAINALDKADSAKTGEFVTAVSEEDGIITVSRAALKASDIPTIEQDQVNGLGTALSGKQDNLAFEGEYNASTNKVATASYVAGLVADLNGAMHFEGVVTGDTFEAACTASGKTFVAGDVVLYGVDEYVYDGSAWHVLGNESIYYLKTDAQTEHAAIRELISNLTAAKQDALTFVGSYSETNGVMTKSATSDAIDEKIQALDAADAAETGKFVTAVSEEDGIISVSRAALKASDIPTIEQNQVNGLDAALSGKQDNLDIADNYHAETNKVATVATVENAIQALDYAGGAHGTHKFVTKVTEEDGVVAAEYAQPTADDVSGLAAIAKTGSTDDLVQGTNVLVFDCGNATI